MQPGVVTLSTPSKYCTIKLRAMPLPSNVTSFLNKHAVTIKSTLDERQQRNKVEPQIAEEYEDSLKEVTNKGERVLDSEEFLKNLESEFSKAVEKENWKDVVDTYVS